MDVLLLLILGGRRGRRVVREGGYLDAAVAGGPLGQQLRAVDDEGDGRGVRSVASEVAGVEAADVADAEDEDAAVEVVCS